MGSLGFFGGDGHILELYNEDSCTSFSDFYAKIPTELHMLNSEFYGM